MKKAGVILAIYILFCSLTGCSSLDHQDKSFVFYKSNDIELICTEPLAVFVDWNNTLNIYDSVNHNHYSTKSRTRFISTLARICSENYYDHISVLTLCSGYNKDEVISDILQDSALVRTISYERKGASLFTTVKPLETPCPVLRFEFSTNYMYCTCSGN